MLKKKITVSGTGCCLVDRLYNNVSFLSDTFLSYSSKKRGDGGLSPGHLVLKEEFEEYTKKNFQVVLSELTAGRAPDKINVGGPCIVALIHAAQITFGLNSEIKFYGCYGPDENGSFLLSSLQKLPVNISHFKQMGNLTPSTDVLSDPSYDNGHGERVFVNSIGSAWDYSPENLDNDFFKSDVVVFGGSALVPQIHDNLGELLQQSKENGCITLVNTVFDFVNEKANPHKRWPLGKNDESYPNIDLLITDRDEALRLSGEKSMEKAMRFFIEKQTGAIIITNGAKNVLLYADNELFGKVEILELPVSNAISKKIREKIYNGDTTGCGDNFVGGVIGSLMFQLNEGRKKLDLEAAATLGIVSGGYACLYIGGTYFEKYPGEKYELMTPVLNDYKKQIK
ncbi:MAG: carbohydrate kinase family protein [Petrimonas sp.]|uniref:carbohydrate kinase family protein n=1 Tax=Petrimonas sp. TaxID=2023866 RepID=UPI002B376E58|nr:carbohydrate kinase family protein [Petrimonas sp.]MEA5043300.1 carbohydrate kinase family protein [Petrimonas sp.]HMM19030.1 carbohydrate kinase family protein [Petrimonas sp.]